MSADQGQRPVASPAPKAEERKTEINLGGINITATGMDPKQVVQEVMDKMRQMISSAASGSLFDGSK